MHQIFRSKTIAHLGLIAAFAFLAMSVSFWNGITSGNDMFQHYQFALSVRDSIVAGEIYPSLAGTMNHGFGDVALRFYPPLSYYVLSIFYFTVSDWYVASLSAFFMVFFVGGFGTYLWVREEFTEEHSLLAAGIYIFAPYHLNQIYNNSLFAEFSATAVLPYCFLFVTRVCRDRGWLDILGLSVSYALLLLTHLPLSVIGSIALLVYSLLLLKRDRLLAILARLASAVLLALGLSAFYWSRMITEINWIKHSSEPYFSGVWGYGSNFLFTPQNLLNFQGDSGNLWLADLMLLSMILISIPTIPIFVHNRSRWSKSLQAIGVGFVFSIFMTTPLSKPLWDNLVFLANVQFPWRWMGLVTVFGAPLAAIGLLHASKVLESSKSVFLSMGIGAAVLLFVFTSAFVLRGAVYSSRPDFNSWVEHSVGNETFEGWWPIWTQRSAFSQAEKVLIPARDIEVFSWSITKKNFEIGPGNTEAASVAALYYPHWKATINDRPADISATESGLISIRVPEERVHIALRFEEPFAIKFAFWMSGLLWLTVVVFLVFPLVHKYSKRLDF